MKQMKTRKLYMVCMLCLLLLISTSSIYADSIWTTEEFDLSKFAEKMSLTWTLAKAVVLAAGTVGVGIGAWHCITGSQEDFKKGLRQAMISLIAVAAFFLLPYMIRQGMDIGQQFGWKLSD